MHDLVFILSSFNASFNNYQVKYFDLLIFQYVGSGINSWADNLMGLGNLHTFIFFVYS